MRTTTRFRGLMQSPGIIVAPGAFNALSARIIEQCGFDSVYLTGYGASADLLGAPDYGLLTLTEMANHASRMAQAVSVPLIADADTGYGNAVNVRRTIAEYERANVAACHLEDQVMPKRCGHMEGKQVVDALEFAKKIEAAVAARTDPDFIIIARTDARAVLGLDEAIKRGKMAVKAGADAVFVEAPQSVDELKRVVDEIDAPLMANMIEHGKTPLLTAGELEELGYKIVIYPLASLYIAAKAVQDAATALKKTGTTGELIDRMITFHEFNEMVGLSQFRAIESKYKAQ